MKRNEYDNNGNIIDPDYEDVAQFLVEMNWGPEYYGNAVMPPGLNKATIVIEGVATSTQAIEKAKDILRSVREDEPRTTKAELKTAKRRIPKSIGSGSTVR